MSQIGLKTGDLDLDLQGQIGLETKKFLVNATTFEPWEFYLQNLSCALII